MSVNDPIVIWGLGVVVLVISVLLARLDRRVTDNRTDIATLREQMAGHDANAVLLSQMSSELRALSELTHRIAGHLNVK